MARPALEVAEIFRDHGPAWRQANAGHVSRGQLKVMAAIESCRTAALGGHVARCEDCDHVEIAYNSCRNRHCPKCQGAAAQHWLAARETELLPVPYYHVVFTLPAAIADIAYQNKVVIYDILFKAAAETLLTIAADPQHLGARIGITMVLHTWGSALTHHPHVHCIVPGGGISLDGSRWVSCRPSSCPCACSRGCSAGWSWSSWSRRIKPNACTSSGIALRSPTRQPLRPLWRSCARLSGSSMPSARSAGQRRCWLTSRATPIGWPSRTAA
jgi:hypothetical protein